MNKRIYQIEITDEKGEIRLPDGLFSFQVFRTKEQAEKWIREHPDSLNGCPYEIMEYHENDIEDYTLINV